ncbi:MAG: FecR family protein, partial [Chitinophagaceae bacterium]|nr:FecR family protein [Chitinophagaceae bacterium]
EITNTNNTNAYQVVYLSDGSIINLAPGSSVRHQRLFTEDKREVYLTGEAFFEVSKNKVKPFYVYTGNIVTRVVGTSFNVSASAQGNVIVAVRTGKVMVYKKGTEQQEENIKMLYPLQQCTYKASINALDVSAVPDGQLLENKHIKEKEGNLNFEDVSLDSVFTSIEKRFGVTLIYDKNEFKRVYITVSVENESLENMLKVICKTAGADFRIDKDFVFIDKQE